MAEAGQELVDTEELEDTEKELEDTKKKLEDTEELRNAQAELERFNRGKRGQQLIKLENKAKLTDKDKEKLEKIEEVKGRLEAKKRQLKALTTQPGAILCKTSYVLAKREFLWDMNLSFDYLRTKIKEMYGDALADVNSNTISIIPEKCNYAIEKPEHLSVLWKQKKIRSDQLPCVSFSVKTSQRDFSTYNNLNGVLTMFNLPTVYSIDDLTQIDFPAEYASDEDEKLIQELFDEIKKRFKALGPLCHGVNEATRTEYISPFMINAVAGCPPGTVLRPQLRFVGSHDKGPVDYAIEYKSTLIRITETKVNELGKGLAQNVVQLQAAAQHNIRKRKRNSDDSDYDSDTIYGIVTTGVEWLVVLFALDSALIRVAATTHNILKIGVDDRSTSDEELRKQVRKVFLIIRTLLKEQIDFNSKKSPTEKKEALCKRIRVV